MYTGGEPIRPEECPSYSILYPLPLSSFWETRAFLQSSTFLDSAIGRVHIFQAAYDLKRMFLVRPQRLIFFFCLFNPVIDACKLLKWIGYKE
jgi:hypothetical protein